MIPEKFTLEQQHIDNADRDITVGQVENRTEKQKRLPADSRYPLGIHAAKEGKIEHIDHLPVQETGITASGRQKSSHAGEGRFREEQSVEGAVEDIAQGTGKDQTESDQDAGRGFFTNQHMDIVAQQAGGDDAERLRINLP